jgi:hypothetical protein
VASDLGVPVLVEQVAVRAALGAFWDALADFAATARVPRLYKNLLFTRQPFTSWHTVLRVMVCVWCGGDSHVSACCWACPFDFH